MNGLYLLITAIIISLIAVIIGKFMILKQSARFWKDSCFVMAEKYNDLLVKDQLKKAEIGINNIVQNKLNELN